MPKEILIATDGSAAARAAVEVGLELAAEEGGRVTFVHSSPELAERLFLANPFTRDSAETLMEADDVLREAAELARAKGVAFELELIGESGAEAVADALLGTAAGRKADMIVLGSRGHGTLASSVLGSVSRGVVAHATMPVLVVRSAA